MRLPETRDLFTTRLSFPITREAVISSIGDTVLESPTGDAETIAEVLERVDTNEYDSPDELYDALVTFVGDQYVGRKFYDDRGRTYSEEDEEVSL